MKSSYVLIPLTIIIMACAKQPVMQKEEMAFRETASVFKQSLPDNFRDDGRREGLAKALLAAKVRNVKIICIDDEDSNFTKLCDEVLEMNPKEVLTGKNHRNRSGWSGFPGSDYPEIDHFLKSFFASFHGVALGRSEIRNNTFRTFKDLLNLAG